MESSGTILRYFEATLNNVPEGTINGSAAIGQGSNLTFTVSNSGTADLTVNTPALSGGNADQFSIAGYPSSPVGSNTSTTFTVRFTPMTTGNKSATLSLGNNDSD